MKNPSAAIAARINNHRSHTQTAKENAIKKQAERKPAERAINMSYSPNTIEGAVTAPVLAGVKALNALSLVYSPAGDDRFATQTQQILNRKRFEAGVIEQASAIVGPLVDQIDTLIKMQEDEKATVDVDADVVTALVAKYVNSEEETRRLIAGVKDQPSAVAMFKYLASTGIQITQSSADRLNKLAYPAIMKEVAKLEYSRTAILSNQQSVFNSIGHMAMPARVGGI